MQKRIRRCDSHCHKAKGTRCACWCQSHFHGAAGLVNREALNAASEADKSLLLQEHGFEPGKTAFLEQTELPLEQEGTR
jgi:hypothetical protein